VRGSWTCIAVTTFGGRRRNYVIGIRLLASAMNTLLKKCKFDDFKPIRFDQVDNLAFRKIWKYFVVRKILQCL